MRSSTLSAGADRQAEPPISLGLFGAPPDTGDLGVAALEQSVLASIYDAAPRARVTVFDHGGAMRIEHMADAHAHHLVERIGAVNSRRWFSANCLLNIRACGLLGGLGNPVIAAIRNADMILDAGGPTGMSDVEDFETYRAAILRQRIALQQHRPLILLPQAFGPFIHVGSKQLAARVVRASSMAWARDEPSFVRLRDLLGPAFDPRRHRLGVEPTVNLLREQPPPEMLAPIKRWLATPWDRRVTINISGEVWRPDRSFTLRRGVDLRRLLTGFLTQIVTHHDVHVLLLPQVCTNAEDPASCDAAAARRLAETLPDHVRERVHLAPDDLSASQSKWVVAESNWCLAMQPRAAVAALSSNVPTAGLGDATRLHDTFDAFGSGDTVVTARDNQTEAALARLHEVFTDRRDARFRLVERLTHFFQTAEAQMQTIVRFCREAQHNARGHDRHAA